MAIADVVLLAKVGRNLPEAERLDVEQVIEDVKGQGRAAAAFGDADEIVRELATQAGPGDVIAVLSNGTFGGIHRKLLAALERRSCSRPS